MGHTVQNKDGKKLHWTKLKEMENKQVRVILGGDYYNRIFTLID
jgi:HKD family nuclease